MTAFFHFTAGPWEFKRHRKYTQPGRTLGGFKPVGLWVSEGTAWPDWCEENSYQHHPSVQGHAYRVEVDTDRVPVLSTLEAVLEFGERFRFEDDFTRDFRGQYVDWPRVMDELPGVIISPYQWPLRLDLMWYYPWDCASGCVWDLSCISDVVEVDMKQVPVYAEVVDHG